MKHFIIFLITVLVSTPAFAQGWEQQNSPTSQNLDAVVFVDTSNGWAVGDAGTIIHTADGGGTWTPQASGTDLMLSEVVFVDANIGWTVGGQVWYNDSLGIADSSRAIILHTSDGGSLWEIQSSDTGFVLLAADFVDASHGWAVGSVGTTWGGNSIILNTTNGGSTWSIQESGAFRSLTGLDFVDLNNGWAVGNFTLLHTTDGGGTWTAQDSSWMYRGVDFVDTNDGWVVGWGDQEGDNQIIVHTSNGGSTWVTQHSGGCIRNFPLTAVNFVDVSHGWAVGNDCPFSIVQTTDGGLTWASDDHWGSLHGVDFVDGDHGWAVGYGGVILNYTSGQRVKPSESTLPKAYRLRQNYPNPFNASTTIAFDLLKAGHVSLRVFDLLGREVAVLKDGMMEAGSHRVTFDGNNLASGIYFAQMKAGEFVQTRKLMLLK